MKQIVFKINGMRCGMCESHINDVVRRVDGVKKVSSSHRKGQTVVIIEDGISIEKITEAITGQGYDVLRYEISDVMKKRLFTVFKK